jgi:phytoene synthase
MESTLALDASYAHCRQIARRAGSNFYAAFFLLPRPKRRAMWALYAFLRHCDDLSDTDEDDEDRREALAAWRKSLQQAFAGEFHHPLLPAVKDTVDRFQIPREYLTAAIDGMEMDLGACRYETFEDLSLYCYRVASVVGLACIHIWGFSDQAACQPAIDCGVAFQLTNILRDLREDLLRDRVYLPQEDLQRFGYTTEDLKAGVCDDRFRQLMAFEVDRAERFYRAADPLASYLHDDGRRILRALTATYYGLLDEIRRAGGDVLHHRVRVGRLRRLWIAATSLLPGPPPKTLETKP